MVKICCCNVIRKRQIAINRYHGRIILKYVSNNWGLNVFTVVLNETRTSGKSTEFLNRVASYWNVLRATGTNSELLE